jgi:hypothetical protein
VFENMVSRGIFGCERVEIKVWRRLRNEELHNLSSVPDVVCMIESRNMGWAGHVALMKEMKNAYTLFTGKI